MVQDSVGQRIGRFERREMGGGKGDMPRAGNGRDQMLAMADIGRRAVLVARDNKRRTGDPA